MIPTLPDRLTASLLRQIESVRRDLATLAGLISHHAPAHTISTLDLSRLHCTLDEAAVAVVAALDQFPTDRLPTGRPDGTQESG